MSDPEVFAGFDVGKSEHQCVALKLAGDRLVDRPLLNDEESLRALFEQLAVHGEVVVVVDQPASIGALPVAVAQDMGLGHRHFAGVGDAPDRGPAPGYGQDRCPRCLRDRGCRTHISPHAAVGGYRGAGDGRSGRVDVQRR